MTNPKITLNIELTRIAKQELKSYNLSEKERLHLDKFIKDYCKATTKYLEKNRIYGEIKYSIDYGK